MKTRSKGSYEIAGREVIADGADLRVQVMTLAAGQCVPWHHHSEISDTFVALEGEVVVETRAPDATHNLKPGQRLTVTPNVGHMVQGVDGSACEFLLIQGVGVYDFVPAEG